MIKCNKCNSEIIELKQDGRGLPVAWCAECNTRIKNMSTGEVIEYYEKKIDELKDVQTVLAEPDSAETETEKPICRWCREDYFTREGRLGTVYKPLPTHKYCPACGRKLKPTDRDY